LPSAERTTLFMHSIAWWPTFVTVLVAAFTDLRSRRIPNWLVVSSLLGALGTAAVTHGVSGVGKSLAGAALGGTILGVFYLLGGMGMGDVKLCAAVGAWLGPGQLFMAVVVMGVAGGVMALLYAAWGGFLKQTLQGAGELVFGMGKRGLRAHPQLTLDRPGARSIPYAPAIAIGTIFSFLAR
jgi:prepilin peptidase CpaA